MYSSVHVAGYLYLSWWILLSPRCIFYLPSGIFTTGSHPGKVLKIWHFPGESISPYWGTDTGCINHKWWIYYQRNNFKLTDIVYDHRSSLVNDAKYIHFYPTFQLPPTLIHCKYQPFIKSIEFGLFRYKYRLIQLSTR